jgi:uncharacterized protein (TIRG00374 family)
MISEAPKAEPARLEAGPPPSCSSAASRSPAILAPPEATKASPSSTTSGVPSKRARSWRAGILRPLRHGITLLLLALVVEYLVVPELVGASHHLFLLSQLKVGWLIAGIVLEAIALLAYSLLTKVLLPEDAPGLWTLLRIDLAGNAVSHIFPGGSAASAGLGYRLTTSFGIKGRTAAFAMATQGMGSAVVLNVLLWCALVISIPLAGFHPIYVVVALIGMIAIAAIAALVYAFTRGEERAAFLVRAVGSHVPFVGAARLERLVRHLGASLRHLARRPDLLRRAILWAALNWLLDAASLWAFMAALGKIVDPVELFAAYGIANVLAVIPIVPGGLGIIDAVAPVLLVSSGVTRSLATLAVIGWRFVNFWLPIPLGAASYVSLRVPRGAGLRARRRALHEMAMEAQPAEDEQQEQARAFEGLA